MKNLFRKIAVLALASVTILSGCGDYLAVSDEPEEPTYSTLQIFTDPETTAYEITTEQASEETKQTAKASGTTVKNTSKTSKVAKTTVKTTKTAAVKTTEAVTSSAADGDYVEYRFRSKKYLDEHFAKHGDEFKDDFGYQNAAEYEKGASDVINNKDALHKNEKEDGDGIYYLVDTNEFVVLSTDGYIRTYFRPDSGKKYYDKQ